MGGAARAARRGAPPGSSSGPMRPRSGRRHVGWRVSYHRGPDMLCARGSHRGHRTSSPMSEPLIYVLPLYRLSERGRCGAVCPPPSCASALGLLTGWCPPGAFIVLSTVNDITTHDEMRHTNAGLGKAKSKTSHKILQSVIVRWPLRFRLPSPRQGACPDPRTILYKA